MSLNHLSAAELRELFRDSGASIRKKWGQNFLIDPNTIRKIASIILGACDGDILEIGAGPGILTAPLIESRRKVHSIEIDPFLCGFLRERFREYQNFELHESDARNVLPLVNRKSGGIDRIACICGNLPYYITSDLLIASALVPNLQAGIFLVQREYAERVVRDYAESSLTVFLQNLGIWTKEGIVPPTVFYPAPSIESAILKFIAYNHPRANPLLLEKILRMSYRGKRKKIKNSWEMKGGSLDPSLLLRAAAEAGIDPSLRPEQIAMECYYALAKIVERTPEIK